MDAYNVKAFYYPHGTQYRVYSKPVRKLTEEEKAMRKQLVEQYGDLLKKDKYYNEESHQRLLEFREIGVPLMECPFTDEILYSVKDNFDNILTKQNLRERALEVSLNRSKQQLIGICRANLWDYFITFTFNPRLVDSSNYEEVCQKAGKWMNNLKVRTCPDLKYVLVPELHKDGEHYHLHGLMANCKGLRLRVSGRLDKKGKIIYNMPAWRYGWNTATEVEHSGKVANYISKYITKDSDGLLRGKKRYWCSHNTVRPDDCAVEYFVNDHMELIAQLSDNIKYLKKSHIAQCNSDVWYIEV